MKAILAESGDPPDQDSTRPFLEQLLRTALPASSDAGYPWLVALLSGEYSFASPQSVTSEVMRAVTASLRGAAGDSEAKNLARLLAAHRQAIATALDHYTSARYTDASSSDGRLLSAALSVEAGTSGAQGVVTTGLDEASLPPRNSPGAGESAPDRVVNPHYNEDEEDDDDEEADRRSVATGIREAQESITRKDDKLTWLLGDGFRAGPIATPPVSPHPSPYPASTAPRTAAVRVGKTKRTVVPPSLPLALPVSSSTGTGRLSPASAGSDSTNTTASAATISSSGAALSRYGSQHVPHVRQNSNASAMMPLLRRQRSASTLGIGRISEADLERPAEERTYPTGEGGGGGTRLLRKRSLSTGEGMQLLTLSMAAHQASSPAIASWSSDFRTGAPFLGAAVESYTQADKPFANLAPVSALAAPAQGPTLTVPESPASSSTPKSRLDRNALTHEQRRELVRRSRKLEGFFGVPFQEEAAQRVLVDGALLGLARSSASSSPVGREGAPASDPKDGLPAVPVDCDRDGEADPPAADSLGTPSASDPSPPPSTADAALSASGNFAFPRRRDRLAAPRMQRSSSSPSRRSSSFSSFASMDHAYYSDQLRSGGDRRGSVTASSDPSQRQREREERRKKLEKVRRFLGERVPVDLVFPADEHGVGGNVQGQGAGGGHVKSASDHWRKGKRLISGIRTPSAAEGKEPANSAQLVVSVAAVAPRLAEWPYIEPEWETRHAPARGVDVVPPNGGVDALSRARKLENVSSAPPPPDAVCELATAGL